MARCKIEWSLEAKVDLQEILEFYFVRNGNTNYSKKLYSKIRKSVKLLVRNPFLGRSTDDRTIRILITGDYQILYEVLTDLILIIMIWDSRREPEDKALGSRRK